MRLLKEGQRRPLLKRGHVRTAALRHCCNLCAACSSCLTHFSLSPVKSYWVHKYCIYSFHILYVFDLILYFIFSRWSYSRHCLDVCVKRSSHYKAMHGTLLLLQFIRLFIHGMEKGTRGGLFLLNQIERRLQCAASVIRERAESWSRSLSGLIIDPPCDLHRCDMLVETLRGWEEEKGGKI